jgi:2-keto-4-pentenoate hydratase/2-oxohepta-3-ene-1,7-dioic acid hydratase in catechol pathway
VYFTGTPHGVGPVKAGDTLYGRNDLLGELKIAARQHKIGG